jgi:para-nitrobenzyl esterase
MNSIRLTERKVAQEGAPAFMYRLDWESPIMGGALRSPHAFELALMFDNVESSGVLTGRGPIAYKVAAEMSQAWTNFARHGNPSQKGLKWPAYDTRKRQTLIFNAESGVVSDPDQEVREFYVSA